MRTKDDIQEIMETGLLTQRTVLVAVFVLLSFCVSAKANVCVYKTLHVLHVEGQVVNPLGETIARETVIIRRGKEIVAEPISDQDGKFHVKVPSGEYRLDVQADGYAPEHALIKVGPGFRSAFHSKTIKMMLFPHVICSYRGTDNRLAFGAKLRLGKIKNNATQK